MALKEVAALFWDNLPYLCVAFKKPVFRFPLTPFASKYTGQDLQNCNKVPETQVLFSAFTVELAL